MKIRWIMSLFACVGGALGDSDRTCEDNLMAPLTCKDILYRAVPLPPDPDVERMLNYSFVLCNQIRVLDTILSNKSISLQERKFLQMNKEQVQRFLQVTLIALRTGYFVFGAMQFRAFLSESQLRRQFER